MITVVVIQLLKMEGLMFSDVNNYNSTGDYSLITNKNILFEQFVTTILMRIANKNDQKVFFNGQNGLKNTDINFYHYDAYAPNGIDDLNGMIFIEIKRNIPSIEIEKLYKKFEQQKMANARLLIITYSKNKKDLDYENLVVWDNQIIKDLRYKYAIDAFNYFEDVFDLSEEDFIQYNESNMQLLKDIFISDKKYLTLVLGAGVSRDYMLPTWSDLIDTFLKKITTKKGISNFKYIFSKIGDSSLIKGQFIIDNFSSKFNVIEKEKEFCLELQKLFYKHKKYVPKLTSTLHSVTKLINRYLTRNYEIITYNYDDLLEKTLEYLSILNFKTIYKDENLKKDYIPIFHVHGYLPREGLITDEIAESIVFSEYKYHKLFNNPYLWQLSCQLTRFRESVCLFIGFSLFDPSVRRLLESIITSNPHIKHYAIFARENDMSANLIDFATIIRHFSRLGVQIIWVDKYDDIPIFIDSL